ncbi:GNAT family N-acetyltransferase [Micromonospora echinofusca]|uniref:GNAT family N-acetyltransferase n=1 Tax=Micromonospora echinofusca TaxID=47858 RepID=A0ABS3VTW0_MICEH|nr:GNAT family protein [Micromonospora echinofusca]MBO4207883.1 GNAT family N-acetyltransferase [Micromonospora echinofusca]
MFTLPIGDDVVLAPLEPWRAAEFAAHLDRARPHITPWVGAGFRAEGEDAARAVLQRYADGQARDDARIYGIWWDGTLVGGAMFVSLDAGRGVCEVGCWLEPAAEGRGLVTRTVARLIDWAVDVRGIDRVEWVTLARNVRSVNVARRLGMSRDGVLRAAAPGPDGRQDSEIWSVLATEWRQHREHLRR